MVRGRAALDTLASEQSALPKAAPSAQGLGLGVGRAGGRRAQTQGEEG